MLRRPTDDDDGGFTLVELLVVVLLLGVVGTIVTSGLVAAMRSNEQAQARMSAMSEMRTTSERMGRELRAACPVSDIGARDTTAQIKRDGDLRRHRFRIEGGEILHEVREYRPATDDWGIVSSGRLLADVSEPDEPLFRFFDSDGEELDPLSDDPEDAFTFHDVEAVRLELRREFRDQPPIEVTTVMQIRNRGHVCSL